MMCHRKEAGGRFAIRCILGDCGWPPTEGLGGDIPTFFKTGGVGWGGGLLTPEATPQTSRPPFVFSPLRYITSLLSRERIKLKRVLLLLSLLLYIHSRPLHKVGSRSLV
jgi:hypothetical protein